MLGVTATTKDMAFECGRFNWPANDDRRVVHTSHVLSMAETRPGALGEGWHELDQHLSQPRPLGRLLLAPATVPFHTRGPGGNFRVARLHFHPADNDLDLLARNRDPALLGDCLDIRCPDVTHGMNRLMRETAAPGFASDVVLDAIGRIILVDVLRYLRKANAAAPVAQRLSQSELSTIYAFVDAHLTSRITIADLAALLDISERHFMRLFRAATGETVHAFVERQRFEKAQILLRDSDQPLKQIAHLLGFSSRTGFTLAFRRMAGQSPQEFRRLNTSRNRS